MSLYKIYPEDLEYFRLETNPKKIYSSSSLGITGSQHLYAFRSIAEKEVHPLSMFSASMFSDFNLDALRSTVAMDNSSANKQSKVQSYMDAVRHQGASARLEQQLYIYRFTPPPVLNSNTLRKNVIRETMFPYYHSVYPRMQWNTTNYNCLNFFSSSNVPTGSVLIYQNPTWYDPNNYKKSYLNDGKVTSRTQYQLSGAFSFDFWIKPTQVQDFDTDSYKPGGIFHMSAAYAMTLHSGSSKDQNGLADHFRICFQYGKTTLPNKLVDGLAIDNSSTSTYAVWSQDNSLVKNKWHHVTVRWQGDFVGSGSIVIDSQIDTVFSWSYSSFLPPVGISPLSIGGNTALFVGNFYSGSADVDNFFPDYLNSADDITYTGGVVTNLYEKSYQKYLETTGTLPTLVPGNFGLSAPYEPTSFAFNYPLRAEVHELKIFDKYLSTNEIVSFQSGGVTNFDHLKFYVPPFFTYESPIRDGELITPFQANVSSSTDTPFGVRMAYGIWGHNINLENYGMDFATGNYPRLWNLTGNVLDVPNSTPALSANAFLYATGSMVKRLYTVLPCDNGQVVPNFPILKNYDTYRFVNDLGNQDLGVISLNNLTVTSAYTASIALEGVSSLQPILANILGPTPDNISALTASSLTVLHRLRDTSSNQIVMFDISNLFYGKNISPGSVTIRDTSISGSNFPMTLKDDGYGNLFRADSINNIYPTWASVGNVLYNEGIIVIKYPQLYFFGENQYEIELKGKQNIHVMTLNAVAHAGTLISSSNKSFPTAHADRKEEDLHNEADQRFVYITGLNIHDENLNVVMRTNTSQVIQKKSGDKLVFRTKLDY